MKRFAGVSIGMFSALTLGLVLLLLGVVVLFGITDREHDEALAQVVRDRERIEGNVRNQLLLDLEEISDSLDETIAAVLADPFAETGDIVLFEAGRLVLPRVMRPDGASTMVDDVGALLAEPAPAEDHAKIALTADERARIALSRRAANEPEAYEPWLAHRASYRTSAAVELASTAFVIDGLDRAQRLTPELAKALLRDGVTVAQGHVPGLFVTLLYGEEPLSRVANEQLLERGRAIAERYTVQTSDVLKRWREPRRKVRPQDVDTDPTYADVDTQQHQVRFGRALAHARTSNDGPIDCAEGSCFVAMFNAPMRGRYVDIERWTKDLGRQWRQMGVLTDDARVTFTIPSTTPKFSVSSDQWSAAEGLASERFVLKASGLGLVALLGIGVFVMAIMLQRRRTAYIELRGQLVSAVTHELKTPLASISALAQTLELRYGDQPQARDYATRIVTSADRLGYLVDNVLSFTRLERGAWKPRFETIHPSEIETLLAEPIARAARPVDLKLDVDDVPFVADRELVRLMLSNLVDNAAKYATADRVAITVSVRATNVTTLRFADDGPGLGERDPRKLFDDFRRGKVDDVRGTGLGLSICRWVASLHGGTIAVEKTSTAGTTFIVTLAKHKAAPHQATRRP